MSDEQATPLAEEEPVAVESEADAPKFDHVDAEGRGFNDSPGATPPGAAVYAEATADGEEPVEESALMLPGLELDQVLTKDSDGGDDRTHRPDEG